MIFHAHIAHTFPFLRVDLDLCEFSKEFCPIFSRFAGKILLKFSISPNFQVIRNIYGQDYLKNLYKSILTSLSREQRAKSQNNFI